MVVVVVVVVVMGMAMVVVMVMVTVMMVMMVVVMVIAMVSVMFVSRLPTCDGISYLGYSPPSIYAKENHMCATAKNWSYQKNCTEDCPWSPMRVTVGRLSVVWLMVILAMMMA